ncbi:MAG: hypothetical protein V1820_05675 [archaeon]
MPNPISHSHQLAEIEKLVHDRDIRYGASYFSRNDDVRWMNYDSLGWGPVIPEYFLFGRDFRKAVEAGEFRRGIRGECAELSSYFEFLTGAKIARVGNKRLDSHFVNVAPACESPRAPEEHPEDWNYYDACFRKGGPLSECGYRVFGLVDFSDPPEGLRVEKEFLLFEDVSPVWRDSHSVYFLSSDLADDVYPTIDKRPIWLPFDKEAARIEEAVKKSWRAFAPKSALSAWGLE